VGLNGEGVVDRGHINYQYAVLIPVLVLSQQLSSDADVHKAISKVDESYDEHYCGL
jgi:hypothetical protein